MFDQLKMSGDRLRLVRLAYRDACLELGIDPSERALTVRVAIVERLLAALDAGEENVAALTERSIEHAPNRPRSAYLS